MGCLQSSHERSDEFDGDSYAPLLDEDQNATTRTSTARSDKHNTDYNLESLLMKLQHALTWRNIYVDLDDKNSIEELRTKLHELLNSATVEMGYLIDNKRYNEAEEIVEAIMKLKHSLGNELLEAVTIAAFVREVSTFENFVLTGGQYFDPTMVNDDDENLLKVFFFLVSDPQTRQTMFRYYVEYSSLIDEFFSLRLITSSEQTRIEIYGSSCPSYWEIRKDVIKSAIERLE